MEILLPVLIVAGIGLLCGAGLSIAAIVMAVPKDERVVQLTRALPGANCGACGFSGCAGYAEALAGGGASVGLCSPGGQTVADELARILGTSAQSVESKVAVVRCLGSNSLSANKADYLGVTTCSAANQLFGGPTACPYGCLGFGDCAAVCPSDAIRVQDGLAVVDPDLCIGCMACVTHCPKGIINLVPAATKAIVLCVNKDKGGETRKVCQTGCIGCMRCVKVCEFDAIKVENFLARVDAEKCTACGKCVEVCPQKCIATLNA